MSPEKEPRLSMRGIEKRFGGVIAVRGAHVDAYPGEILGLCGENGAGKSTLLKILGGVHKAGSYGGEVFLSGVKLALSGPRDAAACGIALVHQELMLVPELSVADNLFLGREEDFFLDAVEVQVAAQRILDRYPFSAGILASAKIADLGMGLRQIVEIVRALARSAQVLILDEPTAALNEEEASRLQEVLQSLAAAGTTCIYVSHRLDEIFALCHRVTVLRDGATVFKSLVKDTSANEVIRHMVGQDVPEKRPAEWKTSQATPALEVANLGLRTHIGGIHKEVLADVSFALAKGEVVAVCGAMGSGRTALLSTIFGAARGTQVGTIRVCGKAVEITSPREAIAQGIAFLPEDRKGCGLVLGMPVLDNLSLPPLRHERQHAKVFPGGFLDDEQEQKRGQALASDLRLRGALDAEVFTLSGGNQQKVVLGKWLPDPGATNVRLPEVFLLDEPTRGVDVGAREEIYGLIEGLCQRGVGVLVASSDLSEVLRLAHRVLILRGGRIACELRGEEIKKETIVHLVTSASGGPS